MSPKSGKVLFINIDDELHQKFKLWCLEHDVSMRDQIISFVTQCVYEDPKPIEKKSKQDTRQMWDGNF